MSEHQTNHGSPQDRRGEVVCGTPEAPLDCFHRKWLSVSFPSLYQSIRDDQLIRKKIHVDSYFRGYRHLQAGRLIPFSFFWGPVGKGVGANGGENHSQHGQESAKRKWLESHGPLRGHKRPHHLRLLSPLNRPPGRPNPYHTDFWGTVMIG